MSAIREATAASVTPFVVRALRTEDITQSAEIEREAFPTLTPPTAFDRELKKRSANYLVAVERGRAHYASEAPTGVRVLPGAQGIVGRTLRRLARDTVAAEPPLQLVVGFQGTWYMVDEAHVVTVGVRADYKSKGIGELLLIGAIEHAVERGSRVVTLEVRPSNVAARRLYLKYGFSEQGMRKGYYADNREDAIILTTDPIQYVPFQQHFGMLKRAHRERWAPSWTLAR